MIELIRGSAFQVPSLTIVVQSGKYRRAYPAFDFGEANKRDLNGRASIEAGIRI